jgi:hypothetical protein
VAKGIRLVLGLDVREADLEHGRSSVLQLGSEDERDIPALVRSVDPKDQRSAQDSTIDGSEASQSAPPGTSFHQARPAGILTDAVLR